VTPVLATRAGRKIVLTGVRPLGEPALALEGSRGTGLQWAGITRHPGPAQPLWPGEQVVERLRVQGPVPQDRMARLHPGRVLAVSDLAAPKDRHPVRDFFRHHGRGADIAEAAAQTPGRAGPVFGGVTPEADPRPACGPAA
jgi:hypothetical protein